MDAHHAQDSITGWVFAAIGAVVSTLATSVAYLFRLREKEIRERIEALEAHATIQEAAIVALRVARYGDRPFASVWRQGEPFGSLGVHTDRKAEL